MLFVFFSFISGFNITDPDYPDQFSLHNTGQFFGIANEDIHIEEIWDNNIFGKNILINVISNGCSQHEDLADGFDVNTSWNYLTNSSNPSPDLEETNPGYGTYIAGLSSARANSLCSVGVAPLSKISCTNLFNKAYTKSNLYNALKRNNDKVRVKVLAFPPKSKEFCEYEDDDQELEQILDSAPSSVNFIASAGDDAFISSDTNFNSLLRHPRVMVISDTGNRGSSSAWSTHGSNIIANAPAGGSSTFHDNYKPYLPGLDIASTTGCKSDQPPIGAGAGIVAGAVALILEMNPSLTWRDVQALIILTSTYNDPKHPSWRNTSTPDLLFSNFYGFGRINLNKLRTAVSTWKALPSQKSELFNFFTNLTVPTMRRGSSSFTLSISSTVIFTETVQLKLNLTAKEFSLLRFVLKSPSGIVTNVKKFSLFKSDSYEKRIFSFTMRAFFGEDPNGDWELIFNSDSVGDEPIIHSVEMKVNGCIQKPNINYINHDRGGNSYQKLQGSSDVVITPSKSNIPCGDDFTIKLNSNETINVTLYLSDELRNSRWPTSLDRKTNTNSTITIPCLFSNNKSLYLIAENLATKSYGETKLTLLNVNEGYFLYQPTRYQVYYLDPDTNTVTINISPSMSADYWIDGTHSQNLYITLYDIDNNTILFTSFQSLLNPISIKYNGNKCIHCILSVVPAWHNNILGSCVTMIQPISIINRLDTIPEQFPLQLNEKCPIPPGILTPTPMPPTPSPEPEKKKQSPLAMIVGILFLCLFALFIGVFFFVNRRKSDLTTALLLTNSEKLL
ncbi:Clan SB, family S8, subtilisin-like serine peptidase [Histomonas meleagridis]|uniref:Clan SB, family S8, subtilisin-like serine peptidase n=1 Tax=Histomonas meleagridis TaxID=135588 RepID=UPI00355A884A|nr:Clan SB, family S8, subtilisin-like serine peptidase [Histomonas meleagridis]KAH0803807.1 Clan SB, family S8, subtilisin-like serine peptidase [Histomonas meleagridis]